MPTPIGTYASASSHDIAHSTTPNVSHDVLESQRRSRMKRAGEEVGGGAHTSVLAGAAQERVADPGLNSR